MRRSPSMSRELMRNNGVLILVMAIGCSLATCCVVQAEPPEANSAEETDAEAGDAVAGKEITDETAVAATAVDHKQVDDEQVNDEQVDEPETPQLSVPLLADRKVVYPDDRPDWLEQASSSPIFDSEESDNHYRIEHRTVMTGRCPSAEAAEEVLSVECRAQVQMYANETFPEFSLVDGWKVQDDWIENRLITKRYSGTMEMEDGETFYESAAVLTFDASARAALRDQLTSPVVAHRLVGLGAVAGGVLISMVAGTIFFGALSRHVSRKAEAA